MDRRDTIYNFRPYKIRVYRPNSTYHIVTIGLSVAVSELYPVLNEKLLLDPERETHRLYLKERGRERVLAQTERPADIVRRRLEQAGYDAKDGQDLLEKEDIGFLLKFVYKSNLLGPTEEELVIENFEYIDLTGRSLKTVPIVLYSHADEIVSLTLSRNPMLEIPRDFIQRCTTLRDLRLSNMAMKKVPQSVRYCTTLHRLEISSNRIVNLDESYLDDIPDLRDLKAQNNRLESLPWFFPRMRSLKYLNISNNKFRVVPSHLCKVESLVDLDISFNMITEIPEEIGELRNLEQLVIVGNQVSRLPKSFSRLENLKLLDCRRNRISDLSIVCSLPKLQTLMADHNAIHGLELALGPSLEVLDASRNDITQLTLVSGLKNPFPYVLTSLDISYAKLPSLDEAIFSQLTSLKSLKLDHNSFRFIPESLGQLERLEHLSCSDNQLDSLPISIGKLQKLETLDAHNNSLTELPAELWNCASLVHINFTSNLVNVWHNPPMTVPPVPAGDNNSFANSLISERKGSTISLEQARAMPPLAKSLERLFLGENRLGDEALHALTVLKELKVLNLSFNDIQEMPSRFFASLLKLEELYLSGNKLSIIPTEDLHRLTKLTVLFLNGNKLQTLPQELAKVTSLQALDVGSNVLKYNINNWEFDWNWNFNTNLKYLNLSGNKRLEIKPDAHMSHKGQRNVEQQHRKMLAGFTDLTQLRILGLMDVTTTFVPNIPEETEDRRVRTSGSDVNGLAYGIADTLGKSEHLSMFDLVQPRFRGKENEAVFAMFGRAQSKGNNNVLAKYLHDRFIPTLIKELQMINLIDANGVPDALRRTFLALNKSMHDSLYSGNNRKMSTGGSMQVHAVHDISSQSGACGIALYLQEKTLYVANAGNALAVVSKQGAAMPLAKKHDPFDREETARIRAAEGWVSPKGLVNDEVDMSRAFGFYNLLPVVNARPYVHTYHLSALDEFVIIGNRGLWDYVSYQTAVDIARSARDDPMIAAQKLRDFAISYGADGSTMIMVISVAELFHSNVRSRQPTMDSFVDPEYASSLRRRRRDEINDRNISRLDIEVSPPVGHVALVFTDIRNSTHLWEVNSGMATAMRLHNNLLRRQLRFCGGYEVKTEGDAFMCSFQNSLSALWWCLSVQEALLKEAWPLEILECEDGKEILDADGRIIERGLSVRMGMHCGTPVCERDPITHRMDYFGTMVNRSARICARAAGGQIMCSADVVREINAKVLGTEPETEYSFSQAPQAIEAIQQIGIEVVPVGEVKLKGLEIPEMLSVVYPRALAGRKDLKDERPSENTSRIQFSVDQMRQLEMLAIRLEALTSGRVFRAEPPGKSSRAGQAGADESSSGSCIIRGNAELLMPAISEKASDNDLMLLMDSLSLRIENSLKALTLKHLSNEAGVQTLLASLKDYGQGNDRTLRVLLSLFDAS
ncbi:adenylate cyclase-like protein [Gloeophyllum trabeum ATCC 11539]|uniref:Adenylate cyclase n=1 Tax=Gloeophyllum trabeum (strain ATCC 11539 / FP-39264 / Madison 617) TaxID=670483 RepID=S7QB42_GLOTA|nr:adenylate cyclase-like protein [Gloeophyllum trabeum ATCC 11539]EPQ57151.1 adenylate cyclase-like protein [Gloeophyllum trabeum ATCC 11539]